VTAVSCGNALGQMSSIIFSKGKGANLSGAMISHQEEQLK
jgi:hypothetical protein